MKKLGKVTIAAICALGAGAVMAQSVVRDGKVVSKPATQTVAQASTTAPVQVAQAGGAAAGATGGTITGAGTVVGTSIFVGTAIAAAAVQANSTSSH